MFECPYCKRNLRSSYDGQKQSLAKANFDRHVNACIPQSRLKRKAVMDVHTCTFCRIQNQKFSKLLNMDKCTSNLGCRCILTEENEDNQKKEKK